MAETRKSYGEGCIAAHALDLIGDRWTLLIARELMLGPKRFGAIKAGLPGIATNMLTQRLADMEAGGVVIRRMLPQPPRVQAYELTEAGQGLWPVIAALCRWGAAMPGHDPRLPISPSALALSMRASFQSARANGPIEAALLLDGEGFAARVVEGRYSVARADPPEGEVLLAGRPNDVAVAVYGRRPLAEVAAEGRVTVEGDMARGQAFVDLFKLRP
ncbi:transcriptional regulator [Paracoccus sp. S-4012]|uniref:winged helix-turn-helix transcriptional regulator n=1 Tax=Paracoccus sp. S-4012 TaxID=2665648 RepID=UPI0012AF2DF3|nr:winged helix-turn-helix transcriptional regulator [Paracoccus sp. S-4012]MRX49743.1 transcriptional regulator [Paracoccus sp. S-4012]